MKQKVWTAVVVSAGLCLIAIVPRGASASSRTLVLRGEVMGGGVKDGSAPTQFTFKDRHTGKVVYQTVADLSVKGGTYVAELDPGDLDPNGVYELEAGGGGGGFATYVTLQASTPGTPDVGHANISGTLIAGIFKGNGSLLTHLNASNISSGILALSSSASGHVISAKSTSAAGYAVVAQNTHSTQLTTAILATRITGAVQETSYNGRPVGSTGVGPVGIYGRSTSGFSGVYGESGAGNGTVGVTNTGQGVWGYGFGANGIGVRATGSGVSASAQGTALQIEAGAIRVPGAGIGSLTPVFVHRAVSSNIVANYTVIDNPLCNGDPNAILIITPNYNPGDGVKVYNDRVPGVAYIGSRWVIFNEDTLDMTLNAAFNVMIFKSTAAPRPLGGQSGTIVEPPADPRK